MTSRLKIVQLEFLQDLGDEELIKSLLALYLEQINPTKDELTSLYQHRNWFTFGKLCHKVKGSVVIFGMNELANKLKVSQLVSEQFARIDLEYKLSQGVLNELEVKTYKELAEIDLFAIEVRYRQDWPDMAKAMVAYKEQGDFSYVTLLFTHIMNQLDISVDDVNEITANYSSYLR